MPSSPHFCQTGGLRRRGPLAILYLRAVAATQANRAVAQHKLNEHSSRSHVIYMLQAAATAAPRGAARNKRA
eukprot:1213532-Pleurochrysis_carterae.AAC.1